MNRGVYTFISIFAKNLVDSLVGRGTEVTGQRKGLKAIKLFVGDDAKVEL